MCNGHFVLPLSPQTMTIVMMMKSKHGSCIDILQSFSENLTNARPIGLHYERFRLFKQMNKPTNTQNTSNDRKLWHRLYLCIFSNHRNDYTVFRHSFLLLCVWLFPHYTFYIFFSSSSSKRHMIAYIYAQRRVFGAHSGIFLRHVQLSKCACKPLFRNEKDTRCFRKRAK